LDPTGKFYGVNLQRKTEFKKQNLVISKRTKHLNAHDLKIEEKKKEIANQYLDDQSRREAALRILQELDQKEQVDEQIGIDKINDGTGEDEMNQNENR
jgi:hypothetical protein